MRSLKGPVKGIESVSESQHITATMPRLLLHAEWISERCTLVLRCGLGFIAKISLSASSSWSELTLISTKTTHNGKVGKLEISAQWLVRWLI